MYSVTTKHSSRTLVACWTTRSVKGFLSFNPLAFTHVPQGVTTSKQCQDSIFGGILYVIVFTEFMVYFGEEISDFRLCCGSFPPMEI